MAALAAAALLCTGCSDKAAQTASTANQTDAAAQTDTTSAKSIQEVYQEIEQSVSLHSPQCMDDDFISNYYGIDAASLEVCLLHVGGRCAGGDHHHHESEEHR